MNGLRWAAQDLPTHSVLSGYRLGMIVAAGLLLVYTASAQATTYYWDTNGTGSGAANGTQAPGTWGIDQFWSTDSTGASTPSVINTDTTDDLYFSAGTNATGAYTVTLSGTQSAHVLSFQEGDVTISGGTKIVLGGTTPTIVAHGTTTIASVIDGTAGLTKLGNGTLILSAANTFSGTFTHTVGKVTLANSLALQNATLDTTSDYYFSFGSLSAATVAGLTGTGNLSLMNGNGWAVALTIGNSDGVTNFSASLTGTEV